MSQQKLIFTGPPPAMGDVWLRTLLAVCAVLALSLLATLLWRAEHWPGSAAVRSLVLGFGMSFGARYGAHGRLRGQILVQVVIGAISSALFFMLFVPAGQ